MTFSTIISEGNLIPADLLAQIAEGAAAGQQPADFGLDKTRRLGDEIAAAWAAARGQWQTFQYFLGRLGPDDPATSVTRERWMLPLLNILGYTLTYTPAAAVVGGRTYALSHRAGADESAPPVQIEGIRRSLDQRAKGGPRLSPHALMQEYLNATEHLWGIVTNGERLRLLRDSSRTTRPSFVEFDLRALLEGEKFAEFALLYRLLHRSRLPQGTDDATTCLLEQYHQQAIEAGGRVREGLRDGVEAALKILGEGLLQHPANAALRARLSDGRLDALGYYRQLLRLVYRLLFLMVAEERNLIQNNQFKMQKEASQQDDLELLARASHPAPDTATRIYYDYYSVGRLRRLAETSWVGRGRHGDLWLGLLATFRLLQDDEGGQTIGLAALDGDLFGPDAIADLQDARLLNAALLRAIRALSLYRDPQSKVLRRVNYAALDVEELGSVYESLLDYRPVVTITNNQLKMQNEASATALDAEKDSGSFALGIGYFDLVSGSERKTTGSYYTRPELVQELVKSALEPVLEERLRAAGPDARAREAAILALTVCDPACGSGHFLLAAARRLGRELARVRSGEDQPAPETFRRAVRDVVARCIYGVDANPLAVDLCKVALWIEGLSAGLPLNFLDGHIRWGNSLVGATYALVDAGIPDEAYQPVSGDDKAVASAFRKRNKKEREAKQSGQLSLGLDFGAPASATSPSATARSLNAMPDDSVAAVRAKARQYEELRASEYASMVRFNLWTAAFFTPLTEADDLAVPTSAALDEWNERPILYTLAIKHAFELAQQIAFFHWELEFPEVFAQGEPGGFDVVLGNPPWEQVELKEEEHWVDDPYIAKAANKAERERRIKEYRASADLARVARVAKFDLAKHAAGAERKYIGGSGRFPLTAIGRMNTYALFAEHARNLILPTGRAGIIVPTGIATDDSTKTFFGNLNSKKQIISLYDFENRENIFQGVGHGRFKFSLLTIGKTDGLTRFVFFATNVSHLDDYQRIFALSPEDIALINPNTRTAPIFRTSVDAKLTTQIYHRWPVLLDDTSKHSSWGVSFKQGLFNMSNDSTLFSGGKDPLPLYEAKMFWHFDHRYGDYANYREGSETTALPKVSADQLQDPRFVSTPRYWVERKEVESRLAGRWDRAWLLAFRDIARSPDERTAIFSILPRIGVGHTAPLIFLKNANAPLYTCFLATVNSLIFDFVTRQKLGGTHLTFTVLNQLPVLPPDTFGAADIGYIVPRVLELVYTAWDMQPFADDVWAEADEALRAEILRRWEHCKAQHHSDDPARAAAIYSAMEDRTQINADSPQIDAEQNQEKISANQPDQRHPRSIVPTPFIWHESRRALIRAKLDARIARLYGLTRDELRYILDPADVYGPEFPGETFRVLKEKETRLYGEYRTRRLVLEAWDREEGRQ